MNISTFGGPHSRGIRFWHWATVFVMSFQLLTAFTGKFIVNDDAIGETLTKELEKKSVHLEPNEAWRIGNAMIDNVWTFHTWTGYALSALLLFRIILEFFQSKEEKMATRIKKSVQWLRQKQETKKASHYLIVKIIYLAAYVLLGILAGTGIWMGLNRNTPVKLTEQFHDVKEIHEFTVNLFMIFLFVHIVGVIRAERGSYPNVVSEMIHGKK
jgi:Ni/Fe-hydrogenase 1 B-type cytochrome subunit